jgi:hypothetical protein
MRGRKRIAPSLSRIRSAITNGRHVLANTDHRTAWMRRLKDLIQAHTNDLGGDDLVSESEQRLIRRAAMITVLLENYDKKFAANDGQATSAELLEYGRSSNTLRRLLESLGLKRVSKDVTPTVSEYLRSKQLEAEAS